MWLNTFLRKLLKMIQKYCNTSVSNDIASNTHLITNATLICVIYIDVPSNIKPASTWISGQDYYRLDGKTPKNIRHEMIKRFNSEANRRARVFLISAKAGGQGINLIGANRVIILDTSWNPSNDQQNIFRIFRLGQKKYCYIYRLIAMVSFTSEYNCIIKAINIVYILCREPWRKKCTLALLQSKL